jgi:hypothetical protein
MDRTRVLEIIAAYGADAARWPAREREAAQASVAGDAALQAEVARAEALDADLIAWAAAPLAVSDINASIAADAALRSAPPARRWWPAALVGGSVAASLLGLAVLLPTGTGDPTSGAVQVAQAPVAPVETAEVEQDVQLWSSVFTLTPEEESLI